MYKKQELLQSLYALQSFQPPHFSKTIYQICRAFSLFVSLFYGFYPDLNGSLYIRTCFFIFFYIKMDETRYR